LQPTGSPAFLHFCSLHVLACSQVCSRHACLVIPRACSCTAAPRS
jgi:hypothetical protein